MPTKVNPKLKAARKLMSNAEVRRGVSPYNSKGWTRQALATRKKEIKQMKKSGKYI